MSDKILVCSRPVNMLFTHSLGNVEQELLRNSKIQPLVFPLLKTRLFPSREFSTSIPEEIKLWVFTSQKAVFSVKLMESLDVSDITAFAVGNPTAEELQTLGFKEIIVGKSDSFDLAYQIEQSGAQEVIHFCGEFHRPELEESLTEKGIRLHKIICYSTEKVRLPIALDTVSGISFSSPRGVEAFHESHPNIDQKVTLFSIGNTTAQAVNTLFPNNPLLISEIASKSSLTSSIIHHFLN